MEATPRLKNEIQPPGHDVIQAVAFHCVVVRRASYPTMTAWKSPIPFHISVGHVFSAPSCAK
eukprot:31657-Eustigmatos_ZCMA.PRE.1